MIPRFSARTAEHVADHLVTAGAFVALADGRIEEVERGELLDFIDRQQLASTIPRTDIAEVFDPRVRQLQDRDSAEVILENLHPLAGLSLASVVLRTVKLLVYSSLRGLELGLKTVARFEIGRQ